MANARNIARQYGKDIIEPKKAQMLQTREQELERRDAAQERKEAKSERDYVQEQRRLAEEAAKKKGSVFDDIFNLGVGELTNLLPVPKVLKDVAKTGLKEGYNKLRGNGNDDYELHVVKISNEIPIEEAIRLSRDFIKGPKHFYKESKNWYKFRNIPKTKFVKSSYRTKRVNKDIQLVYGKLI